jgi:hypothetical protein
MKKSNFASGTHSTAITGELNMNSLKGKGAVVTGAASGIGKAIATAGEVAELQRLFEVEGKRAPHRSGFERGQARGSGRGEISGLLRSEWHSA